MSKTTVIINPDTTSIDTVVSVELLPANNTKQFKVNFLDEKGEPYYDYFTRDEMVSLLNSRNK